MPTGHCFSKPLHKMGFYAGNVLRSLTPGLVWRRRHQAALAEYHGLAPQTRASIDARVAYYARLNTPFAVPADAECVREITPAGKSSAYYYDFRNLIRGFPGHLQLSYLFGDVTKVPATPRLLKSRPITAAPYNANAILLKLNSVRHYYFVRDRLAFAQKKPRAVWRGKSNREHRIQFAQTYAGHPLCDVGCIAHREQQPQSYHRDFLSIAEQLQYQFVVSVEGIDVATNLKWIMSSNSLCMMRRPRFETWFMEGTLVPGYHYVALRDDHSDLVEKIEYYRARPREAETIIAIANRHAAQFRDLKKERMISLLVIEKYLQLSGQLPRVERAHAAAPVTLRGNWTGQMTAPNPGAE